MPVLLSWKECLPLCIISFVNWIFSLRVTKLCGCKTHSDCVLSLQASFNENTVKTVLLILSFGYTLPKLNIPLRAPLLTPFCRWIGGCFLLRIVCHFPKQTSEHSHPLHVVNGQLYAYEKEARVWTFVFGLLLHSYLWRHNKCLQGKTLEGVWKYILVLKQHCAFPLSTIAGFSLRYLVWLFRMTINIFYLGCGWTASLKG